MATSTRLVSSSEIPMLLPSRFPADFRSIASAEPGEVRRRLRRTEVSRALVPLAGKGEVGNDAVDLETWQLHGVIGRRQPKGSRRQANLCRALEEVTRCRDIARGEVVDPTRQEVLGTCPLCRRKLGRSRCGLNAASLPDTGRRRLTRDNRRGVPGGPRRLCRVRLDDERCRRLREEPSVHPNQPDGDLDLTGNVSRNPCPQGRER